MKLEVSIRDLELTKQRLNESFSDFLNKVHEQGRLDEE